MTSWSSPFQQTVPQPSNTLHPLAAALLSGAFPTQPRQTAARRSTFGLRPQMPRSMSARRATPTTKRHPNTFGNKLLSGGFPNFGGGGISSAPIGSAPGARAAWLNDPNGSPFGNNPLLESGGNIGTPGANAGSQVLSGYGAPGQSLLAGNPNFVPFAGSQTADSAMFPTSFGQPSQASGQTGFGTAGSLAGGGNMPGGLQGPMGPMGPGMSGTISGPEGPGSWQPGTTMLQNNPNWTPFAGSSTMD